MHTRLSDILLGPHESLLDAMQAMEGSPKDERPAGIVLVVDDEKRLLGVVTDGDIRRAVLADVSLDQPIEQIMTRDPITVRDDEISSFSYHEILRCIRSSRRMLDPAKGKVIVVDAAGQVQDIVSLVELMKRHEMDDVFAVVLAGGLGTRLWPLSRSQRPKQFLDLTGRGSMLRVTVSRLQRVLPLERIFIVTVLEQVQMVREELPDLPEANLIIEPHKRGTGPAIGLAALRIQQISSDSTMLILPADHLIVGIEKYLEALSTASNVASDTARLVTIGLQPTFAATGYGYIKRGNQLDNLSDGQVFCVDTFVEKPSIEHAKKLIDGDNHLWNTGTFAWALDTFFESLRRHAPELAESLDALEKEQHTGSADSDSIYKALPDISIDYVLMEHADNIAVVLGEFDRIDVGDLRSLTELLPEDENQNSGHRNWIGRNSERNIVYSPGRLTTLVGIKDTIVVVTDDVVLVCAKDQAQEVLEVVKELRESGANEYV